MQDQKSTMTQSLYELVSSAKPTTDAAMLTSSNRSKPPRLSISDIVMLLIITYVQLFDMFISHSKRFEPREPAMLKAFVDIDLIGCSGTLPQYTIVPPLFSLFPSDDPPEPPGPPGPPDAGPDPYRFCGSLPKPYSDIERLYMFIFIRPNDMAIVNWVCRTPVEQYEHDNSLDLR